MARIAKVSIQITADFGPRAVGLVFVTCADHARRIHPLADRTEVIARVKVTARVHARLDLHALRKETLHQAARSRALLANLAVAPDEAAVGGFNAVIQLADARASA